MMTARIAGSSGFATIPESRFAKNRCRSHSSIIGFRITVGARNSVSVVGISFLFERARGWGRNHGSTCRQMEPPAVRITGSLAGMLRTSVRMRG